MPRDPNAAELRAVAPIVSLGGSPELLGALALVSNGTRTVGVTSSELMRGLQGRAVGIATKLDGSATVQIATWGFGRYSGAALVELAGPIPVGHDVVPLPIASVHATVNVHGAPSAIVVVTREAGRLGRLLVPVAVTVEDSMGGMGDATHLASPLDASAFDLLAEGSPAFAWLPPEPALHRDREVVMFALAYPYRGGRRDSAIELVGLEDLGRALLVRQTEHDNSSDLGTVAGEIDDRASDPLSGLDE